MSAATTSTACQLELRRVRLLLRHRVDALRKSWQGDDFGGNVISDLQVDRILDDAPPDDPIDPALLFELEEIERALTEQCSPLSAQRSPLAELAEAFALTPFEREIVTMLYAAELDPRLELLFGYLHDDISRKYLSAWLVWTAVATTPLSTTPRSGGVPIARSGGVSTTPQSGGVSIPSQRVGVAIDAQSGGVATAVQTSIAAALRNLSDHALVHVEPPPQPAMPIALRPLRLDPRIIDHLQGVVRFDALVDEVLRPLERGPLAGEHARLADAFAHEPHLNLIGSAQAGKETLAHAVAERTGRTVHRLDPRRLPPLGPERTATLRALARDAKLLRLAYYVQPPERDDVNSEVAMADIVETLDAPLFVDTRDAWGGARRLAIIRVSRPDRNAQRLLWREVLGADDNVADDLVQQFDFSPEMIARAARAAGRATDARTLWDVCQQQVSWRIDDLAQRITTRQQWDDLVLEADPTAQLREISAQVAQRARVYERWGFAARLTRGRGITALFAGPSGTGKTMAAEILAGELGLELYRIDLAGVVSKYIGESEKNLRRVFDAAEQSGAILFFDEADALFGKRTDVKDSHDLYANIQVNYLLQRMEDYAGLAILATNRKTALDRAFLRRLRFVVDFPFPDALSRERIWRNAFPAAAPIGKVDFEFLGRLEIAGGNIRNIALGAAFLAASDGNVIEERHVMHAVRREYAKIQKLVTETEFGPHYRGRA